MKLLYCLFLIRDRSQIYFSYLSLFHSQSVIKQHMKIKLRMEGAVNGHKFVIEGDGAGNPYE